MTRISVTVPHTTRTTFACSVSSSRSLPPGSSPSSVAGTRPVVAPRTPTRSDGEPGTLSASHERAAPEQRHDVRASRRAAHALRPRVRLRPEHVAVRGAGVRGRVPRRPLRPRGGRRLGPVGLRRGAVLVARGLRRRRARDLRRARAGGRRVRRPLGQRDGRRAGGVAAAGAVRPAGARLALAALPRRRRVRRGLPGGRHRRAARVAGEQLPRVVERDGARDHGEPGPAGAGGGADRELLPHRPGDRPPVRPGHLPLGQPRRPGPGGHPGPRAPVLVGCHRPHGRGRVRGRAAAAQLAGGPAGPRPLPQPQPPRRDGGRDEGLPLRPLVVAPGPEAVAEPGADAFYEALVDDSAEDLYENAPCGYLSTDVDGTIVKVNATLLRWTGFAVEDLVGRRTFADLLTVGGRIFHETHYAPLLRMQGRAREIAVDLVCADGRRLPVLVNAVVTPEEAGRPAVVRTAVFDATERRQYERELLEAV